MVIPLFIIGISSSQISIDTSLFRYSEPAIDFASSESLENTEGEKIRCSAEDDLLRGSLDFHSREGQELLVRLNPLGQKLPIPEQGVCSDWGRHILR